MAKWNKQQQAVLDSLTENKNILVSAAAGSGKTAVLVERIIESIKQKKCSLKDLLVVTFTRSAAAQMKEKIEHMLLSIVEENGDNSFAQELREASSADIMTIDSFCMRIVKENFQAADIDPSFELLDKEEGELLYDDVLTDILHESIKEDESFRKTASFFMDGNVSDDGLKNIILKIHQIADSFADPDEWFKNAYKNEKGDLSLKKWVQEEERRIKKIAKNCQNEALCLKNLLSGLKSDEEKAEAVKEKIILFLTDEEDNLRNVSEAEDIDVLHRAIGFKWEIFRTTDILKYFPDTFENINEYRKIRDYTKSELKNGFPGKMELQEEADNTSQIIFPILNVTEKFGKRLLDEKKREKKFVFSDISHFAYNILYDQINDEPTAIGRRVSEKYKYIYIDEYQDGNDLQEHILSSVARRNESGFISNIFMVGDVKQSIYAFREARPDLFTDKSELYSKNPKAGILYHLNKNYRSRREILNAVNFVFEKTMTQDFGGVNYNANAALNSPEDEIYEKHYPAEKILNTGGRVKVVFISKSEEKENNIEPKISIDINTDKDNNQCDDMVKDEEEAFVIAGEIKKILYGDQKKGILPTYVKNDEYNQDMECRADNQPYRKAEYKDIVILQRNVRGTSCMVDIYEKMGLPVKLDDPNGYFDADEVIVTLALLQTVDNISEDLAFTTAILAKPFGITETDLAVIVSDVESEKYRFKHLVDKVRGFISNHEDEKEVSVLVKKVINILDMIDNWKKLAPHILISELIQKILSDTGLDVYAAALDEGDVRIANLEQLIFRAERFDNMGGGSLFDFLRYIEKCRLHEIDFAKADVINDQENVIRVTTIHSSKGLEYPIVILARTGHKFKLQKNEGICLAGSETYLSADRLKKCDHEIMVKIPSFQKKAAIASLNRKALEEELRILYVAMTRAKEKLIITGVDSKNKSKTGDDEKYRCEKDFLDSALICDGADEYFEIESVETEEIQKDYQKFINDFTSETDIHRESMENDINAEIKKIKDKKEKNPLKLTYPHLSAVMQKTKMSVSEIKHQHILEIEPEERKYERMEKEADDSAGAGLNFGAMRGTVIHRILELLDYGRIDSAEEFKEEVKKIFESQFFTEEEKSVNIDSILKFYDADENSLFQKMKKADSMKRLFREQQFTVGLYPDEIPLKNGNMTEIKESRTEDDRVIIQGIIDAYMIDENGNTTLIDYKTDSIKKQEELIQRYSAQMYLYKITLEKLTGLKVNDIILYSFKLGEIHCIDEVMEEN